MRNTLMFLFVISFVIIFEACNKSEVNEPTPTPVPNLVSIRDFDCDSDTVHYTFFRFKDSAKVPYTDSNTTKWDIAFLRTKIIVNSGASGPGKGGVILMKNTLFDTLSEAPASGYSFDTSATKLAITASSGKGWYNYDFASMTITPIPGVVLVFKTADEKYVKLRFISYYKGNPNPIKLSDIGRYYWFDYVYQPDGSRKFK